MNYEVEQILVIDSYVGILGIKEMFRNVQELNLQNEEEIKSKLLELAKKRNYIPDSANEDYKKALWREYRKYLGEDVPDEKSGYLSIKVLGTGGYTCDKLMEEIKEVLAEMNLAADLQHIHDLKEINKYDVIVTPGLVINNKIKSMGRKPGKKQIKLWIEEAI